jgi:hypothetical protein
VIQLPPDTSPKRCLGAAHQDYNTMSTAMATDNKVVSGGGDATTPSVSTSDTEIGGTQSPGSDLKKATEQASTSSYTSPSGPIRVVDLVRTRPSTEVEANMEPRDEDDFHPGWRLWAVLVGLGVTCLLSALENTVVTVAAPVIVTELGMGENYIWITDAFFICTYVDAP